MDKVIEPTAIVGPDGLMRTGWEVPSKQWVRDFADRRTFAYRMFPPDPKTIVNIASAV